MGDIYTMASRTIYWLGVEVEDTSLAFTLMQILSRGNEDSASAQYEEALTPL